MCRALEQDEDGHTSNPEIPLLNPREAPALRYKMARVTKHVLTVCKEQRIGNNINVHQREIDK